MSNARDFENIDWGAKGPTEFWSVADAIQQATLEETDEMFAYLAQASANTLREILIQYRYFTVYYIPDLALLVARLPDGPIRSFLAEILNDELGLGKPEQAHPRLYDDFLESIGVDVSGLSDYALAGNIKLLDEARKHLADPSRRGEYAVGLRGMGGECVCQIYIAQLHRYLVMNPYIRQLGHKVDWRFWDLHVGDHDIAHREHTRALIDREIVQKGGEGLISLGNGYAYSVGQWQAFWRHIFRLRALEGNSFTASRTGVRSFVDLAISQ